MAFVGGLKDHNILTLELKKNSFPFCDLFKCFQWEDRLGKKLIYVFGMELLSHFIVRVELSNRYGPLTL